MRVIPESELHKKIRYGMDFEVDRRTLPELEMLRAENKQMKKMLKQRRKRARRRARRKRG